MSAVACGGDTVATEKVKKIAINLTDEDYAFAVAKGNDQLLADINKAYDELKADGTIENIMNAYFGGSEVKPVPTAKKDASKKDKQLVVATETGFAPFEYMDGENLYGIDMQIMAEIAKKLNKELVVEDMLFSAVVSSVSSGLADVAAAALTVTPERQESVAFSKAYYQASQVVVVASDNKAFDNCKTQEEVLAVIEGLPKGTKAAFQSGTTGNDFVKGYANLTPQPYDKVGLAATSLINGDIDLIVVDKAPAEAIVKSVNKK